MAIPFHLVQATIQVTIGKTFPPQGPDYATQSPLLAQDELFDYTVSYDQCHVSDQTGPTEELRPQPHEPVPPRNHHYNGPAGDHSSRQFPPEYSFARPTFAVKQSHSPLTSNDYITVLSVNGKWHQIPVSPAADMRANDNIPHTKLNRMAVQSTNMGEIWAKNSPAFTGTESDCTTTTSLIRRWTRFCQVQWQSTTAPIAVRSFISFALSKTQQRDSRSTSHRI